MPELLEQSMTERLDVEHRNLLQAELMKQMLGEEATVDEQLAWIMNYGQKVSDLIDHHEHDDIRALALAGDYEEAAKRLGELLELEVT